MLGDPKRDAYQKSHEVITALKLKDGEVIADTGPGSGYFTFRLAHHVGDTGRIYSVDVSPEMVVHLNRRVRNLQLKNVVAILAAAGRPAHPHQLHRPAVDRPGVSFPDRTFSGASATDRSAAITFERHRKVPSPPHSLGTFSYRSQPTRRTLHDQIADTKTDTKRVTNRIVPLS